MVRLSFALMLIACIGMSVSIVFAQGEDLNGGTVRGRIVDTTEKQNPIEGVQVKIVSADSTEYEAVTDANGDYKRAGLPAGRYLLSIYKEGYGDRVGKPVTVVNGGDHFVPLLMTKNLILLLSFKDWAADKRRPLRIYPRTSLTIWQKNRMRIGIILL